MAKQPLTAELVRERLRYDAETGDFYWRVKPNKSMRINAGDKAGNIDPMGYIALCICENVVRAHRIAWLYVHGEFPNGQIDHINGIRSDNRLCNLRVVTNAINSQNIRKPKSSNTSGFLGVHRSRNSWIAAITLNGRLHHLGSFSSPEAAHERYIEAKRKMHPGCTI